MALEIRPYRPEEAEAFYRVPSIVFGNYQQPVRVPEDGTGILPEWSLCGFEDGELATTYAAYPFTIRLNGAPARAAGVTYVGTLPWHRRKGHLRAITQADFKRRYEEQLEPIALLTASISGIYHRYGYAVVSTRQRYSIDPRWIRTVPSLPEATGRMREAGKDELPQLKQRFAQKLAGRAPEQVVAYCGSGVTACHNLFALALAGYPLGRLYAGSWSEWINDPGHGVATGD